MIAPAKTQELFLFFGITGRTDVRRLESLPMISLKTPVALLILAAGIADGQNNVLTIQDQKDGWRLLFDGKSLAGWDPQGSARWNIAAGVLSGTGDDGWLRSIPGYSDFDLKIDFRNSRNWNSGVFLRATQATKTEEKSNPAGGYELQIYNEDPKYATGSIEDYIQRTVAVNPSPDEWHSFIVQLRSDHITAFLDGQKVLDGKDSSFRSGNIGLQHHRGMDTQFRNIKVRSIPRSAK
jgi:hypothetical protein